jgi:hypothetical protein
MKLSFKHSDGFRHPKQIFVPLSEFQFASFPVRLRPMRRSRVIAPRHTFRGVHLNQKGVRPWAPS